MKDKKLSDLTVGDLAKIVGWVLGIPIAIAVGITLWGWLFA